MGEQLNGHAQMDANAAATIAANQVARQVTPEALAANAQFDKGEHLHAEANVLNKQIDQGAVITEKIDDVESRRMSIEARRTSPDVQAMNAAADVEIFGSRGRTQGYVDEEGKPLAEPIEGTVDKIRGVSKADEIRQNPRFGTKESDRNAAADAYEAQFKAGQDERDARAEGYVESIEELQAEGFELSQAKLIHDLGSETGTRQRELFEKLVAQAAGGRKLNPAEEQKIKSEAVGRVIDKTVRDGDDLGMLKRVIKNEGLFDRGEYEKFRYKRGNKENGERKEFSPYREKSIQDLKNFKNNADRSALVNELNAKTVRRVQIGGMKAEAEAEAATRREEEAKTAELNQISDPSREGLRDRIRNMMIGASFALGNGLDRVRESLGGKENNRRKAAVAGILGGVALLGGAYLELKGGSGGATHGGVLAINPSIKPHHHEALQQAHSVAQSGGTTAPAPQEHAHVANNGGITAHEAGQHKDALNLSHEGDTIEDKVAGFLHTDLKDPNVSKVTETILHNQGISWDEARHLPVGYSFNMPPQHVLEELLKNGKTS